MIKLSVGLPFFRSKYIGWAALESLCRQEHIDFEWELVVIEEQNNTEVMGREEIERYLPRLNSVGCVSFNYVPLVGWIPLGKKLKKLVSLFSDTEVAIWNPDDYYAPPRLLSSAYHVLKNNKDKDWFSIPKTIFYNIKDGRTLVYDVWATKQRRKDDSTARAFRTPVLKKATQYFTNKEKGCDAMVRESYKKALGKPIQIYFDKTDSWKRGLNIKGLNNISHAQKSWFNNIRSPRSKCDVDLSRYIPKDILDNLMDCRQHLSSHKEGVK